jgi:hypothetical protein
VKWPGHGVDSLFCLALRLEIITAMPIEWSGTALLLLSEAILISKCNVQERQGMLIGFQYFMMGSITIVVFWYMTFRENQPQS